VAEADEEDRFAPEEIIEATAEQQQGSEGERVGSDYPLPDAAGEAEVGLVEGRAMFTTVTFRTTISCAMPTTPNTPQRVADSSPEPGERAAGCGPADGSGES
jgi:hypothetical protein